MAKTALVTGVSGQDGAYLAQLLLARGYRVLGSTLAGAAAPQARLAELKVAGDVELVEFELADVDRMAENLRRLRPHEIYNLAAQSSVALSFAHPLEAAQLDGLGVARLLEAIRKVDPAIRLFQASSADMFEEPRGAPQDETTPLRPSSPYAVAKAFAHWQCACYRASYGVHAACGILFNHESPLRGREFVTRKITLGLAEVKHGRRDRIALGNLEARRDWGFAGDYVEGMWRMLQHARADDYVLATGVAASVREFATLAAQTLGFALEWSGEGEAEAGIDRRTGRTIIAVSRELYRPAEVATRIGNAAKAKAELGWAAKVTLPELVAMMVEADERRVCDGTVAF
jgi:GDPmannose 4,6-dehydratase